MPSVPAYERDPRRTELDTDVIAAGAHEGRAFVVLADTILYPEGGGQPADRGTVDGVQVVDVQKGPEGIHHYLSGDPPSGSVHVVLEWARRFDHMQQHTAQHLLTAVADRMFGWATTSFHLGERVSDIELDTPAIDAGRMAELEEAVAAEIRAAHPVTARRVSPEAYAAHAADPGLDVRSRGLPEGHGGDVRLVEIEGVDLATCGGTHVGSTAEVEALALLDTERLRGGTRLSWLAGGRLRRAHAEHHLRNARLRALLGASDEELVARIEAKLEQLAEAERAVRGLREELADAAAAALVSSADVLLVAHWTGHDLPFLQRVAREVVRRAPERTVFLTAGETEEGAFLLAAGEEADLDVAWAGRKVAEVLEGRGGGAGRIFQGRARRLSRREAAAATLR